jgi:hypothetical protein
MVFLCLSGVKRSIDVRWAAIWGMLYNRIEAKEEAIVAYHQTRVTGFGFFAYAVCKEFLDGVFTRNWLYFQSSKESNVSCDHTLFDVYKVSEPQDATPYAVFMSQNRFTHAGRIIDTDQFKVLTQLVGVSLGKNYVHPDIWFGLLFRMYYDRNDCCDSQFAFAKLYPTALGYDRGSMDLYLCFGALWDDGCDVYMKYHADEYAHEWNSLNWVRQGMWDFRDNSFVDEFPRPIARL